MKETKRGRKQTSDFTHRDVEGDSNNQISSSDELILTDDEGRCIICSEWRDFVILIWSNMKQK